MQEDVEIATSSSSATLAPGTSSIAAFSGATMALRLQRVRRHVEPGMGKSENLVRWHVHGPHEVWNEWLLRRLRWIDGLLLWPNR